MLLLKCRLLSYSFVGQVLGGRARARGSGGKALKVTVVFLVILFILTQLAFMSSTSDEKDVM